MTLKVWNGSAWQLAAQMKVWNGTSWVSMNALDNAKSAKVWNGSSWVQFHPGVQLQTVPGYGNVTLDSSATAFSPDSASALAGINLFSSGNAQYIDTTIGTQSFSWLLTGPNSDYYAYMDAPTGSAFSTGTTGASLQLNTTRAWSLSATQSSVGSNAKSLSSVLRIKNSAGSDILSVTVNISVYAEVF
ncbi:MAG: hypothetical protein EBY29_12570 [Planctomycetes bacterium]|nr:hypothetical protein [Planctomycetota bacterium]